MWTIISSMIKDVGETAAVGGISLGFRGTAAFGAPPAPILEIAAFDGVSAKE